MFWSLETAKLRAPLLTALFHGSLKNTFGAPVMLPITTAPEAACAPCTMAKMALESCGVKWTP